MVFWIVFSMLLYFVKVPNTLTASLQMSASLYRKDQLPTRILVFMKVTTHPFLLIAIWNLACIILHEHNFYQNASLMAKILTLISTFQISSFYFVCLRNFCIQFYTAIYKIILLDLISCNKYSSLVVYIHLLNLLSYFWKVSNIL